MLGGVSIEYPLNAVSFRFPKAVGDVALNDLKPQGIIFAQFIPECERALGVFVNEKARSRWSVRIGG
jgi:hypothetical protein